MFLHVCKIRLLGFRKENIKNMRIKSSENREDMLQTCSKTCGIGLGLDLMH